MLNRILLPLSAAGISRKREFAVQTGVGGGAPTFVFYQSGEKLTGAYNGLFATAGLSSTVKGDSIAFAAPVSIQDHKGAIVCTGNNPVETTRAFPTLLSNP